MAMLQLLRGMNKCSPDGRVVTAHGFRSTFRTWTAECTSFSRDVAEMALAHTIENKVEASYQRGDMLERRRALMNAWASFCLSENKVERLNAAA